MVIFKDVELSDKVWIDPLLRQANYRGAEYCFTNLFVWSHTYQTQVAHWKDFLLIRAARDGDIIDIFPAGKGDYNEVIALLRDLAIEDKRDLSIAGITQEHIPVLTDFFKGGTLTSERNSSDYIYKTEDLRDLKGKAYQPKRNHIARFTELPDWKYENISEDNVADCIAMNRLWCEEVGCGQNESLEREMCAAEMGLRNFTALGLEGALLRVSGNVMAYTVGEPINSDTYIVHIEKAFSGVRGAYPAINQLFVKNKMLDYIYINREDDAGDEGLRKAKSSYHPAFLLEKHFFAVSYKSLSLPR